MQKFTPPSLASLTDFLVSGELTAASSLLHREARAGSAIPLKKLEQEMLILMGRIAYR